MTTSILDSVTSQLDGSNAEVSKRQVDLGSVSHTGDHVASHNYGSRVGGHVVGLDQSRIDITTSNIHNYSLYAGASVKLSTGEVSDGRLTIINWLSGLTSLDFHSVHRSNLAERYDGTGGWFLANQKFKKWREGRVKTLWCYGIPGSGKTILSSIVIEHIEVVQNHPNSGIACLFIFFDHQSRKKQTAHSLTIDLLGQLIRQQKCVSLRVQLLYDEYHFRATAPNLNELLNVIEHESLQFDKIWLTIDALDECPAHANENTREEFLQVIRRLPANFSFLVTSRNRKQANCGIDPVDEIEVALEKHDLETYVRGHIHRYGAYNEKLANMSLQTITNTVSRNAKGMFLLARLHMNDLVTRQTQAALESALDNLPAEINETYGKAMHRIPKVAASVAKLVLMWVTLSLKPLTTFELRHALAMNEKVKTSSAIDSYLYSEHHIISICAGLINFDDETGVVRLVHPTAKTYFRDYFAQSDAHHTMASTCIWYLMLEDVRAGACDPAQLSTQLQKLPFLQYAAQNWGYHAREVQEPEITDQVVKFLSQKHLSSSVQHIDLFDFGPVSPLCIAAHFGLEKAVDRLLVTNSSIVTEVMNGQTAIHETAEAGYSEVMSRLLAADGAEPNMINEDGRTPLSLAAENGNLCVVQQLLAFKAVDPDCKTTSGFYRGRTPLSWAAGNGHESIVGLLLATKQVDVNSSISSGPYAGRTSLLWASIDGNEGVVSLLCGEGNANPTVCDGDGRTPLSYAAQHGHEKVITELLQMNRKEAERKDDIYGRRPVEWALEYKHEAAARLFDFKDEHGRTQLSYEAENGRSREVKMLIDMRADVDSKDKEGWTPMMYAADAGYTEVVKMVTESGANQDLQCSRLRSAISYAAAAGYDKIVKQLLSTGASPDLPDWWGRTPLSYAAGNGHNAVVSLLLSFDGVDPNRPATVAFDAGRTPLSFAAARGKIEIVKMLIEKGVTVDTEVTDSGVGSQSPLGWATCNGHGDVVDLLRRSIQQK